MPANYVLLERIELNASAASVVFANIPQSGYTDLKIVASGRGTRSEVQSNWLVSFNGSTSNFTARYLEGTGGGTSSGSYARFIGAVPAANATASTFGSLELYIPNYLSNTNKSYSVDSVTENNATLAFVELVAGLWSDTSAINSITISSGSSDNILANSTFSLYGLAAVGTTPVIAPKATGGNLIENDGTYWIHTFTSTGTFTPLQGLSCDYLVVAGGAGGGAGGGGAGAGGLRSTVTATGGGGSLESPISVSAQAYAITVGAGGAGAPNQGTSTGTNGSNSVFSTVTSVGGGGGGSSPGIQTGANGGSGGGSHNSTYSSGTANQGYGGGIGVAGGGGGAGSVGQNGPNAPTYNGGNGGSGVSVAITGASVAYAGGGGGSGGGASTPGSASAGGGAGTNGSNVGNNGTVNTGGGAGSGGTGGAPTYIQYAGGTGGSGIVIIRYTIA